MYDSQADNKLYLAGSIMLYKSRPVHILEADEVQDYDTYETRQVLKVRYLGDKAKPFSIKADSKHLRLEPIQLGYINTERGAVYLKRTTAKYYKKGISSYNVTNPDFMDDKALTRAHHEAYPTLSSVANTIELGISNSMAFHRDWAVKGGRLMYKDKHVGDYVDGNCKLYPKFKFLTTRLKEATRG